MEILCDNLKVERVDAKTQAPARPSRRARAVEAGPATSSSDFYVACSSSGSFPPPEILRVADFHPDSSLVFFSHPRKVLREIMDITYRPYIDPEFEVLIERIHPPRVCVDNDTYPDCTLVKVDSANKHGMLLEMVQVLTDLDLVISKSYISSDGGWLMDVFHVNDQQGNKLTDESLIHYIQEGICASRQASREFKPIIGREVRPRHVSTEHMALEMTGVDRPGLLSEMSAVLAELGCHVTAAVAWTHNSRAACILYVEDSAKGGLIDPCRVAQVQAQLENVVEAHHYKDEQRSVRLAAPVPGQTHTERRLHQLLAADGDYKECCSCCGGNGEWDDFNVLGRCHKGQKKGCNGTHVKIENCKETGYSIVTIRSRDRPKLLFDTEYYVRHKEGGILSSDCEKRRVTQCLIAATERRVSHGLRLDICTRDRTGLLSDVTRVFRESGLSITRAEMGTRGKKAIGTFYVKDTSGQHVTPETVEIIRREIGGSVTVVENKSSGTSPEASPSRTSTSSSSTVEERSSFSLGNLLWAQLERLSSNFRPIKS
ncbi:ACT domain-containing protein ACR1 [Sesamum alatum]|uniref:ACT domain-containing protein ACR n=1 Tax=Sesamum alatum TaxID=300844 RepID=A0AAE1XQT0_9LAMI|nr:ACT domain-containing protein ACR1 [Sesamum alatum]